MAELNLNVRVDVEGQNKLSGLGAGMQRVGANLTKFVTLPLLGIGAASLAMAGDAEKSAAKLNAAFRNMGQTSGKTLVQLQEQATALGETTTFDDEAIMEAQAALLTFGAVGGDAFDRALTGALDYAAATGKDAVSATQTLGKVLADPVAGLSRLTRLGVILTDTQKDQVRAFQESGDIMGAQGVILQAFEDRYAGVNAELANTSAGQAAQALEDLQNAGEDIGVIFLPMLASLAQGLSTVAKWFTSLDPAAQTFIVTIAGVVAAVGPAVFIAGKLIGAFQAVGVAFRVLSAIFLTNPFILLAAAIIAIAALIILNWDKVIGFLKGVWQKITDGFGAIAEFLRGLWNTIMGGVLTLALRLRSAWDTITGAVSAAWNGLAGIIKGAINLIIGLINGFIGFVNGIQIHIPSFDIGPVQTPAFDWWGLGIPTIPYLAEGGIITQPTLAILGEQGPEAVIPLDENMGGRHFHSHIEVRGEDPFIRNPDDLIRVQQRIAFLEGF